MNVPVRVAVGELVRNRIDRGLQAAHSSLSLVLDHLLRHPGPTALLTVKEFAGLLERRQNFSLYRLDLTESSFD